MRKLVFGAFANFTVGIIHRGKTVNGVGVPAAGAAANGAAAAGRGAAATTPAPTPCGRTMATVPAGGSAGGITHDSQTEIYYIVSGSGMMFTDGYIVNGRHNLSPDLNGPTCGGVAFDVVKKVVNPGDIIIVPAGVVHGRGRDFHQSGFANGKLTGTTNRIVVSAEGKTLTQTTTGKNAQEQTVNNVAVYEKQ